ncbi:ABC transporter substrate-binding protein [Neobacillus drentensis]|uniref:ABC transporter substrate-binding protein n=1 Tax=Neobacillus drentensis TaxID=220684 RepID=UPI001F2A39FE|nr:ABC transporter substrate-binding protein [Neobacillus drentensis]ULT54876.1 ABC transporter substrate-binding protein [Neobacillus drentensis]
MKKRFKLIALLVLLAATILSGCSGASKSSNGGKDTAASKNQPVEITYAFPYFGTIPKDLKQVEDEINKLSIKEINVKVKLKPVSGGNWNQQVTLMISGGENLDLMPTLGTFNTMAAQKQLIDITDLLQKYGQGIQSAVGDNFLKGTSVDGKIYGVTVGNGKAAVPTIVMRKDILDKYGLSIDSVKTLDDIAKIYEVVSKKEPEMAMLIPQSAGNVTIAPTSLLMHSKYDGLGDNFGVLLGNDSYKVENVYETDEYKAILKTMREWNKKGYIMKGAATSTETAVTLLKSGKGFSQFTASEVGVDTQLTRNTGHQFVAKKLQDPLITSSALNGLTWVIPVTSKNPEAAMKFLNLTYTNADLINLIDWGIEGKHYVKKSDGTIGYPKGLDANNTGYGLGQDWLFGNQMIAHVWEGNDPNNYKILAEDNKTAPISNALGFTFDSSKVKTEIASVTNVVNQYQPGLDTGSVDPNKQLPVFISKLKAAGIDKIIAEKQKQLDEWVAKNKK